MPAYARPPRVIEREKLDFLAGLYDLAAHSLDPLSEESAKAENQFCSEVARLFDDLPDPKPELKAFQKKDHPSMPSQAHLRRQAHWDLITHRDRRDHTAKAPRRV